MQNLPYDRIGRDIAKANLAVCKSVGVVVGFQHRDELQVPIRAMLLEQSEEDKDLPYGRRTEHDSINLMIPTQQPAWSGASGFSGSWSVVPGWSGAAPSCGDRIEYPVGSGEYFYVEGTVEPINHGWTYRITGVKSRTSAIGEKEAGE